MDPEEEGEVAQRKSGTVGWVDATKSTTGRTTSVDMVTLLK